MKALIGLSACLFVGASAFAQVPTIDDKHLKIAAELRDEALKSSIGYEVVESLTTEVGPRMAGTPGDAAAVKWGVAKQIGRAHV